ncbi:MAG TPA: sulfite oxidase [Gemmatimonadaceae bacterium]|nr:sulfite oxidase [Gemmatimonadaceae bacterium]
MADDLIVVKRVPLNAETPPPQLTEPVTPSSGVYVRTNFGVPDLSGREHRIGVAGAVRAPRVLSARDLLGLPQRSVTCTMECAGNDRVGILPLPQGEPWGGGALSTAVWTGVPLSELLDGADLSPDAVEVLVEGADGGRRDDAPGLVTFGRALSLAEARSPDVLLALEMNGRPLAPEHGAPVRLVVPGWYGMASVKWVSRITVLTEPYTGYFQTRRYIYDDGDGIRPVTRVRVKSIIAWPASGAVLPVGTADVWGWAWSGEGAIRSVELSQHGGDDGWQPATLEPPASPYAWARWHRQMHFAEPGRYVLRSRASDAAGNVQPSVAPWNRLGYGNNAIRTVLIDVR